MQRSQKIILLLKSARLDVVYIITEQPSILFFFQSVNQTSVDDYPYIPLSYQQVNERSPVTYKGFFLSQSMGDAIKNCSYRDYYKRILSVRKQCMEAMHA
ncbi:hypothetical protein AT251_22970 [Enterovibrio nigricans]|nr:hypothetical protein AT251_22970 [Enterovibrio nigricans]